MAAGDTISGQVRYVRQTQTGDQFVVFGPFSSRQMDQAELADRIHVNITKQEAPLGAVKIIQAKFAKWLPGEQLQVQHLSASLAEAGDYDADEFEIGLEEKDLNTGIVRPRTLTVADTELSANPTTSTTVWTQIFRDTCPDRRAWRLKYDQKAAIIEVA